MNAPLSTVFITESISSLLGWLGTGFYLFAYLLISINKLKADRYMYHLLNVLGAMGLIVHAIYMNDGPNLICNVAWLSIALIAIVSIGLKHLRKVK